MFFKIHRIEIDKIVYSFSFHNNTFRDFEYSLEFINFVEREKPINYLFALLQVVKDLPIELREQILYRSLISEFREQYFIDYFDFIFSLELETDLIKEDFNCDCHLENNNCNHYFRINYSYSEGRHSLDSFYYLSD